MSGRQIPPTPLLQSGGTGVPAVLAKQGVGSVSDNLFPGDTLKVGRLFMAMFQTEIEARLVRTINPPQSPFAKVGRPKSCADINSSSCRSDK
jgi:hypothetical protein